MFRTSQVVARSISHRLPHIKPLSPAFSWQTMMLRQTRTTSSTTTTSTPSSSSSSSSSTWLTSTGFETLRVVGRTQGEQQHVLQVEINRPRHANAMSFQFFSELRRLFDGIESDPHCRVVILSGCRECSHFSSGIDLSDFNQLLIHPKGSDVSRIGLLLRSKLEKLQEAFTAVERCRVPVIAAIHGACIGAGFDLACAADIRVSSADAVFQIKEVDLGLAADVGTLQRIVKIVGNQSLVSELALTARKFNSTEAKELGFVNSVATDREALNSLALGLASQIALKSPIAIAGTKRAMIYSRDHTVSDSLQQIADWNMLMLQSKDILESVKAMSEKTTPSFSPFLEQPSEKSK